MYRKRGALDGDATGTPGGRAVQRGIRNIATNSGLTGRESQIAALAAEGRTIHKIADRLFSTASTIEHVAQSHNWRSVTSE
jgi:DNA-binding NarL/FixJ family response regulator